MHSEQTAVFTLMVDNEFGVLTRITAMIRRAGWNIRSLAVAETENSGVSRLTICLECKNNTLEFVLERLGKLNCVREVSIFSPETQAAQELALICVKKEAAPKLDGVRDGAATRILSEGEEELMLAVVSEPDKIDRMLCMLDEDELGQVVRTGTIALKLPK